METSSDKLPGVKEAAKTYLAAKEIPLLFQVAQTPDTFLAVYVCNMFVRSFF